MDRCEAKKERMGKALAVCDEEVPNVEEKPRKNEELRKLEERGADVDTLVGSFERARGGEVAQEVPR